jgi:hypothetical protein
LGIIPLGSLETIAAARWPESSLIRRRRSGVTTSVIMERLTAPLGKVRLHPACQPHLRLAQHAPALIRPGL